MRRDDLRRTLRNIPLIVGIAGLVVLGVLALFGPQLSAADPQAQRLVLFYPDGTFKVPPTPPDAYNPLGTDPLGRDQLARVLWGARLTLTVVLLALALRAALALTFGILAGWRGGATDAVITLITNAVAGVPQLLLALLLAVALREHAIIGFVVALGLVGWSEGAQFVRGEVARIRAATSWRPRAHWGRGHAASSRVICCALSRRSSSVSARSRPARRCCCWPSWASSASSCPARSS
jgi:ABC-type dipeptide/oligopeptide/nickel transport system permease subunit